MTRDPKENTLEELDKEESSDSDSGLRDGGRRRAVSLSFRRELLEHFSPDACDHGVQ